MTSVTFPPEVGGDGSTVSDDANPTTGLRNGGHRTRFVAALVQMVAIARNTVASAQAAAASALTALNAPGTTATSTTPQTWTGGSVGSDFTWGIQTGKTIVAGMDFKAARTSAAAAQAIYGAVKSYNPTTGQITLTATSVVGSGTGVSDWSLSLTQAAGIPTSRTVSGGGLATGGGDLSANRTITVTKATPAEVAAGNSDTVAATPKGLKDSLVPVDLVDQATLAWDMSLKETAKVVLGGNRTLDKPTNYKRGETKYLEVWQDVTGGRTLALHACFEPGGQPPVVVSPGANKMTLLTVYCFDDSPTNPRFRYGYSLDAT